MGFKHYFVKRESWIFKVKKIRKGGETNENRQKYPNLA